MTGFSGKHVVVTGASTGIGRATAHMLGARGANVFLIARRADVLAEAVSQIKTTGGMAACAAADVANTAELKAALQAAVQTFGDIDGLFANAGTGGSFAKLPDYADDMWTKVMSTNVDSVFQALKVVLPGMIARRRGSIVVTGSLASARGLPANAAYIASKHAVLGLARAAAAEAAPHQVRVNCILPGLIETPMLHGLANGDIAGTMAAMGRSVPMGHVGSADETAELVCFLLSDAASHITAQSIAVDGGILGTLKFGD